MTDAPGTIFIVDADGNRQPMAIVSPGGVNAFQSAPRVNGAAVSDGNRMPVYGSVAVQASATGGASTFCASGATGEPVLAGLAAVKASPGTLYSVYFLNQAGADAYIQLFDEPEGSVSLGSAPPKLVFWVPAGGVVDKSFGDLGIAFGTAITIAATTTAIGATPAAGVIANLTFE